jgi:hypothetical protein
VFRSFLKDSIDRGEKTIHIVETEKRADYLKRLARFKFFCGVAVVGRNSFAISRVPAPLSGRLVLGDRNADWSPRDRNAWR